MRRTTKLATMLVGATVLLSATAYAASDKMGDMGEIKMQADLANGQKIFKEGKGNVPACTSCHGEDGLGNDMMGTPRIAGQVAQFLIKQLEDFATDKRMDTTMFVMNANAKGLSRQDRVDVSAYLHRQMTTREESAQAASNLEELKASGVEVGLTYLGKAIVNYGIPEKDIPACKSCHDYNGRGVDPIYPKIGEQKYAYLVSQLKKWRDGSRTNDPLGQMRKVAKKMSDADINNAAAYLTGASAYSMGNTRLPEQHAPMAYDPN